MPALWMVLLLNLSLVQAPGIADRAAPGVTVSTTTLTLDTCPYASSLEIRHSDVYNMDYPWLNWSTYDANCPSPAPHDYAALVVENPWLRLTFLPELGGRLYGVTVKATGEELLYQNPVIKPTNWGMPEQGWWLAAGGIEWCLPVEEHGYEWGVPWSYSVATAAGGATVTLWDTTATDRIRARVTVFLAGDRAAFQITPRLENPTGAAVTFKFWDNAMLAPGAANTVGPDLRFVFPIDQVTVHSRGDDYLPGDGEAMSWPVYEGSDYSRLGNWNQWLGFFARPQAAQDWAGVYDEGVERGVARVFPHEVAAGIKGFGFGWDSPIDWDRWTNDGSTYVEIHGGPSPTFGDSLTLGAGGALEWTETWLPLQDLPALSLATADAALGLKAEGSDLRVGVVAAGHPTDARLCLWRKSDCSLLWHEDGLDLMPGSAHTQRLAGLGLTPDDVLLAAYDGTSVLAATGTCAFPPPESQVALLAMVQTSTHFEVSWSGMDHGGGLASYDIQVRDGHPSATWNDWLLATTATSAFFDGQDGHTYAFRSRARDLAGSVEAWPENDWDDAFTTVLLQPAPVLITSGKVAQPLNVRTGEVMEFQIHLKNTGNLAASVWITDTLPGYLSLTAGPTSNMPPAPVYISSTQTITWRGPVAAGVTSPTVFFEANVLYLPPGGVLTNAVWVDDGIHPPFIRQVTANGRWPVYLPLVLREFPAGQ